MSTEIGEALREAMTKAEDAAPAPVAVEAPLPEEPTPGIEVVPAGETAEQKTERLRDEAGRFAKSKAAKPVSSTPVNEPPKPSVEAAPAEVKPVEPKPAPVAAPQSWKPALREKWGSLPPDVQAEVVRREKETQAALTQTGEARRFVEEFSKVVSPHRAMLQADGAPPLQVIDSALRTMAVLRTGTPQNKAAMVAQLVNAFGVDVQALDSALAAAPAQKAPEYRDPRVDTLMGALQQAAAQKQQAVRQGAQSEVAKFAEGHEFFETVREDMADLVDASMRRGVELSMEDAYVRACRLHPEVWDAIQQRDAAAKAQTAQAATAKAKAAASSVKSNPSAGPGPQPSGIRAQLEAAIEAQRGR